MTDWLHCNKCCRKLQPNLKFFLKECGRIECQKCLNPTGQEESNCIVCKKSCKTILLDNNIKPEIQIYFKSTTQLLDTIKKVYEFQKRQQGNLINHIYQKYNYAKNEAMKYYKLNDNLKKEISRLRAMLKVQRGQFQTPSRYITSTPLQSQNSPTFDDGSISTVSNIGSILKKHYRGPGYPQRIIPEDIQSFSTGSSSEHVVPGSRQSMVPTHKSMNQIALSTLMSQMLQNSHSRGKQH